MALPTTDARNELRKIFSDHDRATQRANVSLYLEEWDGTWSGDAHATGRSWSHGGLWSPTKRGWADEQPLVPAVSMRVQAQQVPPLLSDAQFTFVFGGERSGKTFVGRQIALKAMIDKPGCRVFYLLPKFSKTGFVVGDTEADRATDDAREGLIDILDDQGWIATRSRKYHRYVTIFGSQLQVFSAADKKSEESFLGGEADLFIIEEFREMNPRVFLGAFSRIISTDGRLVIVTSPEAGHMIEEVDAGEWDKIKPDVHHLSVARNFFVMNDPDRSVLETAKAVYDDRQYRKRVLGENVADAGVDFYNWEPERHALTEPPGIDATKWLWRSDDLWLSRDQHYRGPGSVNVDETLDHPVICGMDFGASVVSLVEARIYLPSDTPLAADRSPLMTWENAILWCEREHQEFDSCTVDFVDRVMIPRGVLPGKTVIFCDPAGAAREPVTGRNSVDYLRSRGYRVFCKPGGTKREPGIDAIRVRLHMDRLAVSRAGCPTLVKNMARVRSIGRGPKEVSRDPDGHLPDALRYIVDNLFPVRDVVYRSDAQEVLIHALRR